MTGIDLVRNERLRQLDRSYDAAHDDQHVHGELAEAAERIVHHVLNPEHQMLSIGSCRDRMDPSQFHLPIIDKWRHDPVKLLTIAAALLVAEIERRQRIS
jgi:hypothetical protein